MTWNPKDDIFKQFAMTPDEQLLLWDDWIRIRENDIVKIAYRTMRPPVDLAMNQIEKFRPNVERKITLEEVQRAAKVRQRTDSVWEQKLRLKQRCPCENAYRAQENAADRGKPKVIRHVLCPDYIQQNEKGLIGEPERNPCTKLNRTYYDYREYQEQVHKDQILKVDPFRPDLRNLAIIGRLPAEPTKQLNLPVISISSVSDDSCRENKNEVYALRINKTILVKNKPGEDLFTLKRIQKESNEKCSSWTYYFNIPERRIGRSKLFLENLGTVSLRYCWKKIIKTIPYIPEETYEQHFFFNKNEDVISPGQKKTIYFTFVSPIAGIYSESWELALVNVSLFDDVNEKISVHLVADSVENMKKHSKNIEKIVSRIDRKATHKFVLKLLKDLIVEITIVKIEPYSYKHWFDEGAIFVARNTQYFYHQTEVQTLKELYKQMTDQDWDLSVLTWRNALIEKEFDERMMYYDHLKKSHVILLKPWYEGDDVVVTKHRAVKLLLGKLADTFYDEFQSVAKWNGMTHDKKNTTIVMKCNRLTGDIVHNIFYMKMYTHIARTMETIAGTVSSIDLDRWIEFDFCQS